MTGGQKIAAGRTIQMSAKPKRIDLVGAAKLAIAIFCIVASPAAFGVWRGPLVLLPAAITSLAVFFAELWFRKLRRQVTPDRMST